MTKISPEIEENVQTESVLPVSADVSFATNRFPKYKIGPDNQILEEPKDDNTGPSLKEVVEQETTQLSEQHKRLSVRDLASKFDKNLTAAAKLADEVLNISIYFLKDLFNLFYFFSTDTATYTSDSNDQLVLVLTNWGSATQFSFCH